MPRLPPSGSGVHRLGRDDDLVGEPYGRAPRRRLGLRRCPGPATFPPTVPRAADAHLVLLLEGNDLELAVGTEERDGEPPEESCLAEETPVLRHPVAETDRRLPLMAGAFQGDGGEPCGTLDVPWPVLDGRSSASARSISASRATCVLNRPRTEPESTNPDTRTGDAPMRTSRNGRSTAVPGSDR